MKFEKVDGGVIDMLLDDKIRRELRTSEFLGDCPIGREHKQLAAWLQQLKRYKESDKSIKFTLKQWNIIEELLNQENIALQDRCEICEDMIRTKYNGGISNGYFLGELSQIHLEQLQDRKKEIEKMLKKLESEEL